MTISRLTPICTSMGYEHNSRSCITISASLMSRIALVIILALGIVGTLPASTVGYTAIGLVITDLSFLGLADNNLKKHKWQLLMDSSVGIMIIALSVLMTTGVISAYAGGVAALTSMVCIRIIFKGLRKCDPAEQERIEHLRTLVRKETEDLKAKPTNDNPTD